MTTRKPVPKPLPSPALTGDRKHEPPPPAKIAEAFGTVKTSRCHVCGTTSAAERCPTCGNVV